MICIANQCRSGLDRCTRAECGYVEDRPLYAPLRDAEPEPGTQEAAWAWIDRILPRLGWGLAIALLLGTIALAAGLAKGP